MSQRTSDKDKYDFAKLWSPNIASRLYTRIPMLLTQGQGGLGITSGEFNVLVQLISYRWTTDMPYPSIETIARQMGCSRDTVRRHLRSLEKKGFIRRNYRKNDSSKYDLSPLIAKLDVLATKPSYRKQLKELAEMKSVQGANMHPKVDAAKVLNLKPTILRSAEMHSNRTRDGDKD